MTTVGKAFGGRAAAAGVLAICALAAGSPAGATGTSNVSVTVTAMPSQVTLSQPSAPNFASYQIRIKNNTHGNLSHVRFRGTTDVAGDGVAPFINPNVSETGVVLDPNPVVVSAGKVTCTIEGPSIECTVGHYGYLPHGSEVSFNAVVRAPVAGSKIEFDWKLRYGSGYSERSISGTTVTTLQTPSDDTVSAYVPRAGATLLTGDEAVPTADDRSTTRLTVAPEDATAIIASIAEDDNGGNSCSPHVKCFGHTVTVLKAQTQTKASLGDGLRKLLVVVLRRDASTIRKGTKIEHDQIFYQVIPAIGGGGTLVRECRVHGVYKPPGPSDPCIRERREYPKKHGHGHGHNHHDDDDRNGRGHTGHNAASSDLSGDREFVIEAVDNGRYAQ
ncbi:MAG: hypothetical protein ACXW13_02970 [Burkholderiaceae bacterium]